MNSTITLRLNYLRARIGSKRSRVGRKLSLAARLEELVAERATLQERLAKLIAAKERCEDLKQTIQLLEAEGRAVKLRARAELETIGIPDLEENYENE